MAEVRPFQGVHYDQVLLRDWAKVFCPVYDIISPQQQQELYLRSEYNFVRLEFARELPQDSATDNKYGRAAAILEQWMQQGVLMAGKVPAIYLYDQYFTYQGKEYKRRGLVVRVCLEEWDKMVVRPHEGTMAEPKTDRLNLLWTLQANTSPILSLYEDRDRKIASLLAAQEQNEPLLNLKKVDGEGHRVWAITDSEIIGQIQTYLADQPLYIADGHHRYESALNYQRQRLVSVPSATGEEGFNFVMMTLVDFTDPGLLVLPPHRLVRGISRASLDGLMPRLKVFFDIEELSLSAPDIWQELDRRLNNGEGIRLAVYGPAADRIFLLRLRDIAAVSSMMPYFHSDLYKKLDVSVLDHVILGELLGLGNDKESQLCGHTYDKADAVKRVSAQEYQLAFLIRPVNPKAIKAIADVRDRMPRKSTYFYPKLPAGLIIHRLS
ncbi:MAG: DUF1015 domain-containing protein [Chloroflexi bacterium]|nr:DUF1015 domain-containing protein [Chloroflexota bacterium]